VPVPACSTSPGAAVGEHLDYAGTANVMVVLLSMSMGAQLATIRFLKVPDLLTVVLTMTITGAIVERERGWRDPTIVWRGAIAAPYVAKIASGSIALTMYCPASTISEIFRSTARLHST
jgi:Protein of unknown function (DUF1275)